jgi:hypothetical protein
MGYYCFYWCSTYHDDIYAYQLEVYYGDAMASRFGYFKTTGFAVRLVKD